MPEKVKMNYQSMEAMAAAFGKAHSQIDSTKAQMSKMAKSLDDGALQGQAGDALRDAIMNILVKNLEKISDKMAELEKDIRQAKVETEQGISNAKGHFSG